MIFQLMKAIIVYSLFTCELWRLLFIPHVNIFRPPYSYLLLRDLCFLTGLELIHKKDVWIFSKALITWVGTDTIRASKTFWECPTFKGNYSSFRSKILKSPEFEHTFYVGNDFEEDSFILLLYPSWNSDIVTKSWKCRGWRSHNVATQSKMRVVATSVFDVQRH